jgi:NTE family protein
MLLKTSRAKVVLHLWQWKIIEDKKEVREMTRKKIGIALGGGAARGIAHIGVLEVLEKEGISIDVVAGTSAGAVVGVLYASGMSPVKMKEMVNGFDWNKRCNLMDFSLPKAGLIPGNRLMKEIEELMGGDLNFDELKKPFGCVACDLMTGEEVIMTTGSAAEAVRASIAMPIIFQPIKYNGRYLFDGGLVNQVPVSLVKAMGADYVIAVNVGPRFTPKIQTRAGELMDAGKENRPPNIINIILKLVEIANSSQIAASLNTADIAIEPNMANIGPADFQKDKLAILQGEMAASDAVFQIKSDLAKN